MSEYRLRFVGGPRDGVECDGDPHPFYEFAEVVAHKPVMPCGDSDTICYFDKQGNPIWPRVRLMAYHKYEFTAFDEASKTATMTYRGEKRDPEVTEYDAPGAWIYGEKQNARR